MRPCVVRAKGIAKGDSQRWRRRSMKLSTHRLRRLAGLGLVVAAMAVPNALAGHEDLGPRGSSEIAQPQLAEHFLPDGYQPQLHGEDAVSRWLRNNPDGYQPQLHGEDAVSRWFRNNPDGYQPQLHGEDAVSRWFRNNPDGYQPQLRGSVEALTGGTAHAGGIDAGVWAGIGSAVTILTVAAALAVRRRGGVTQS
jgi:hypothetical protein